MQFNKTMKVSADVAREMKHLLSKPDEDVGPGEVLFDEEVKFDNGFRIAVQVVASLEPGKESGCFDLPSSL